MYPLSSRIYIDNDTLYWQLENREYDFSLTEFQDLVEYLKIGHLFDYLEQRRPVLKSKLLQGFHKELKEGILEEKDIEVILERSIIENSFQLDSLP